MKKITLKIDFELDDCVKSIAQDEDGQLYAYEEKPKIDDENNAFFSHYPSNFLAHGAPNPNWKDSLVEL